MLTSWRWFEKKGSMKVGRSGSIEIGKIVSKSESAGWESACVEEKTVRVLRRGKTESRRRGGPLLE
jgi:hypothetical protein